MKKLFLFAVLATLSIYFGCNKADKNEPAPATTNTEVSNHTDATHNGENAHVTSRASCEALGSVYNYCDCECCCILTLIGPLNVNTDVDICGPNLGCPDDVIDCQVGPSLTCGVNAIPSHGGIAVLNTANNDHKIFCSGDVGDIFQITNPPYATLPIRFNMSCDGSTGTGVIVLNPGEAAIFTKGTECAITNYCIY